MARKATTDNTTTLLETILRKSMDEVMHQSMMPYAEHVILERALPRVEDGLKPVQRRILYSMLELGLTPDKPYRKSATVVGACLGKYHPHGDSSVYEAMVRLAQPFNMGLCLVDGHGNFGSMDGDGAAAMRYTEARMTPAAMQLLSDIDKDTVDFAWNFDDSCKEPTVLPGRFPNLLINGSSGIAVGLATNIPPHNPQEAIDAVIAAMDNPKITTRELMAILPAPDFPTGAYILNSDQLFAAYDTGRGKLTMRARTHFEEQKNGKTLIVITEFPYQVNKAAALSKILELTQEKKSLFSAVGDIRDESDRSGVRAVIEIKKDGDAEKILQYLFKYSDLQCTFGCNFVAIADGKPQQLSLKDMLNHYIRHQREVVTRRTKNELEVAKKREHILAGLMVAVDNVELVIKLIRSSKTPKEARQKLMERFSLSEIQAQAILDLRLQRLTNLELITIEKEYNSVLKLIAELEGILASDKKLNNLIKRELNEIRASFMQKRRTQLISAESDIVIDEQPTVIAEDATVAVCADLKIRRIPTKQFNLSQIEAERPLFVINCKTDRSLRLFTDLGAMLTIKVCDIPETRATAKATNLNSLLPFEKKERIVGAFLDDSEGDYLFFTEDGMLKRTSCSEYNVRAKRTAALTLKDGDRLLKVSLATPESIIMVTEKGMCIRFEAQSVPPVGRAAAGVKALKLMEQDRVIFAEQVRDEGELLVVSDRGYGKRSFMFDYELQGRNGKGVKTFDFKKNQTNGTRLAFVAAVTEPFDFTLTQRHGNKTVLNTEQVHIEPRSSKGTMLLSVVLDDDIINPDRA